MSRNLNKRMNKKKVLSAKMKGKKILGLQLKSTNQNIVMKMKNLKKRGKKNSEIY